MAPEDVFYKRMGSLENIPQLLERKNRFGDANPKTLGFCMVCSAISVPSVIDTLSTYFV